MSRVSSFLVFAMLSFFESAAATDGQWTNAVGADDQCSLNADCALMALQSRTALLLSGQPGQTSFVEDAVAGGRRRRSSTTKEDISTELYLNFSQQADNISNETNFTWQSVLAYWRMVNESTRLVFGDEANATITADADDDDSDDDDDKASSTKDPDSMQNTPTEPKYDGVAPREAEILQRFLDLQEQMDKLWTELTWLQRMNDLARSFMNSHPQGPGADVGALRRGTNPPRNEAALTEVSEGRRRRSALPLDVPAPQAKDHLQEQADNLRSQLVDVRAQLKHIAPSLGRVSHEAKVWRALR